MEEFDIENNLRIHSIESFGTVDGPGIRFVIFTQGCHLRCKYCHNRDTWNLKRGKIKTIDELISRILKYKNYFMPAHGGITITGGEPLLQSKALITLFKRLKELNIHTAIDTSGMFNITKDIEELISLTDLFLLDIKHIDPIKCKNLVGASNEKELEFAKYLSKHNKKMWIRQVLVPGLTDQEEDLIKLRDFIKSLKTVEKVEILPYHNLGEYKWNDLGFEYELSGLRTADSNDVKRAKEILEID